MVFYVCVAIILNQRIGAEHPFGGFQPMDVSLSSASVESDLESATIVPAQTATKSLPVPTISQSLTPEETATPDPTPIETQTPVESPSPEPSKSPRPSETGSARPTDTPEGTPSLPVSESIGKENSQKSGKMSVAAVTGLVIGIIIFVILIISVITAIVKTIRRHKEIKQSNRPINNDVNDRQDSGILDDSINDVLDDGENLNGRHSNLYELR
jgi:outer membrane biosynthesis protein TonB